MGPLGLSGHLGDRTAALVDGQLPPDQVERAWAHVQTCPGCREAVTHQVAAKQALGGLCGTAPAPHAPASWLGPDALAAWEQVAEVERAARRRTTLTASAVGGGLTATLAVALVVGATGVLGPVLDPREVQGVPADVRTGLLTTNIGTTTVSWTGSHSGAETARVVRGDRSR